MCDLMVLAFQTDVTRIATFMVAREGSEQKYRMVGVNEGHHTISHHQNRPANLAKLKAINVYFNEQLAYLIGKLKAIKEGDGTLLDNCMIAFGSGHRRPQSPHPRQTCRCCSWAAAAARSSRAGIIRYPPQNAAQQPLDLDAGALRRSERTLRRRDRAAGRDCPKRPQIRFLHVAEIDRLGVCFAFANHPKCWRFRLHLRCLPLPWFFKLSTASMRKHHRVITATVSFLAVSPAPASDGTPVGGRGRHQGRASHRGLGRKSRSGSLRAPGKPITSVDFTNTNVTDTGLKVLAGLKSLQTLYLGETQVTDAGLKELAGLKSLEALHLGETRVTDAGLKELAGLKSLKSLYLGETQVTDAGLKELTGLTSLQTLHLGETQVTDAGLKVLAGIKSLETLDLNSTSLTGAGLKELTNLKSLQHLYLGETEITDAALKELAGLKSLRTLDLFFTPVTDAGLKQLAVLQGLKTLVLNSTKVTDAGLKELASLTSLESLDLGETELTGAGLKDLASLKSLRTLDLSSTKLTGAGPERP